MMKIVIVALAIAACSASTVYTIPGAAPFHGLPFQTIPAPLTYAAHAPFAHAPIAHPLTYATGPLVNPAPYRIQTGVRADVKVEPVEQHGYVIKY